MRRTLRFVTFLAPNLLPLYEFITSWVGEKTGLATELVVGTDYRQLVSEADVAFVCGLAYVRLRRRRGPLVEPLAAPVLQGPRYAGRPVYYADVVVQRDSPFRSFADLRGCTWAYNERHSQSGCGVVRYHLARLGEARGYFGRVLRAGWHERSLRLVCAGKADAAAIDSHVLEVFRRHDPERVAGLRVIAALGPSTIQPVVASRRLPSALRQLLRKALLDLGRDARARPWLDWGLVEQFVPVNDASYDDIRHMLAMADAHRRPHRRQPVE